MKFLIFLSVFLAFSKSHALFGFLVDKDTCNKLNYKLNVQQSLFGRDGQSPERINSDDRLKEYETYLECRKLYSGQFSPAKKLNESLEKRISEYKDTQAKLSKCENSKVCHEKISDRDTFFNRWFVQKNHSTFKSYGSETLEEYQSRLDEVAGFSTECSCYLKTFGYDVELEALEKKKLEIIDKLQQQKLAKEKEVEEEKLQKEKEQHESEVIAAKEAETNKILNSSACKKINSFISYCYSKGNVATYAATIAYERKIDARSGTTRASRMRGLTRMQMDFEDKVEKFKKEYLKNPSTGPSLDNCTLDEKEDETQFKLSNKTETLIKGLMRKNCAVENWEQQ